MTLAAFRGSWTPASWITISFPPWTATFGEVVPSLLTRLVMICCAVAIPAGVIWSALLLLFGIARSTTSRPPCRSRPSVAFLWTGEPGTTSNTAPTRSAAIAPKTKR